jgi:two-component system, LytTR family, sensor kinase
MLKSRLFRYVLILLIWCVFALIATTFIYASWNMDNGNANWSMIARRALVTNLIWGALLSPAIFWLCNHFPIEKRNWIRTLPIHLAASLGAAFTHAALRTLSDHFTYPDEHRVRNVRLLSAYFFANGYSDLWMYWLFAFLALSLVYYRKFVDREVSAAVLQAQLARTELQMLKMQLHPHFLFNTLHSISALMQRDVPAADRMLVQLSDLLRITLDTSGSDLVTFKHELEMVHSYVEIEKTRFEDRLAIVFRIEPETLDAQVPSMLMQPLIENAVRYGIARRSGAGQIEISATICNDRLRIMVVNDAAVEGAEDSHGIGIGLRNTQSRLQHLYGDKQSFQSRRGQSGKFEVCVELPVSIGELKDLTVLRAGEVPPTMPIQEVR